MKRTDFAFFPKRITTPACRRAWFVTLKRLGFNFHPDTRGHEYTDNDGNPSFTPGQAAAYDRLMEECFAVEGDVYGDALEVLTHEEN